MGNESSPYALMVCFWLLTIKHIVMPMRTSTGGKDQMTIVWRSKSFVASTNSKYCQYCR